MLAGSQEIGCGLADSAKPHGIAVNQLGLLSYLQLALVQIIDLISSLSRSSFCKMPVKGLSSPLALVTVLIYFLAIWVFISGSP